MSHKKDLPIVLVVATAKAYSEIRSLVIENYRYVHIEKDSDHMLLIKDNDSSSKFYFKISSPTYHNRSCLFQTYIFPETRTSVVEAKSIKDVNLLLPKVRTWINIIKEFESNFISAEEKLQYDYEKEQEAFFEPMDSEYQDIILDTEQQLKLSNYIIRGFQYASELDEPQIANDLVVFESSIGKLNKRATQIQLNKILAKARVRSIPLFKKLLNLLASETFSFVVQSTFTRLIQG